ncbi:MAG: cytochrome C, partial [Gemmatimonadota bacterium]
QGEGENVENWREVPSRQACGSCHDDIDWAAGTNHPGGAQANDNICAACHPATGNGVGQSVTVAHDWESKDVRNVPEFSLDLSVSEPPNGRFFRNGETPVVTLVISQDGSPIDHTTVVEDADGAEGCVSDPCPAADGAFDKVDLYVHGPRGKRLPALTTAARAVVLGGTGPFDLSAAGASLALKLDGGGDAMVDGELVPGTVTVEVADGSFADLAAATRPEVVQWLQAERAFRSRAIASVQGGQVVLTSKNLGPVNSIQLLESEVTTQVFGGDTAPHIGGGGYAPSNSLLQHADSAEDDPQASWSAGAITYTLDPIRQDEPGTYMVSVEVADRGRVSGSDYKTPSVAKTTFQVRQAAEELPVARACDSCHQGPDGRGFVLDYARHHKIFDDLAVDQCGACHDYQNGNPTGPWYGGNPISRRVHAVHFGSSLHFPVETVGHADTIPGRDWDITLPQDPRNCEACHPAGDTTGTWNRASRLPCSGCHDSEAVQSHMQLETWDPTPDSPWNGDEQESCQTCH